MTHFHIKDNYWGGGEVAGATRNVGTALVETEGTRWGGAEGMAKEKPRPPLFSPLIPHMLKLVILLVCPPKASQNHLFLFCL